MYWKVDAYEEEEEGGGGGGGGIIVFTMFVADMKYRVE